jgi:hypothetical protein
MTVEDQIREIMLSEELPDTEKLEQLHALIPADACEIDVFTKPSQPVSIAARPHFFKQNSQEDTVIFPTGPWSRWHPTFAIRKSDSNTLRKVLEKRVDAGENRRAQKTKAMPRTLTIVFDDQSFSRIHVRAKQVAQRGWSGLIGITDVDTSRTIRT